MYQNFPCGDLYAPFGIMLDQQILDHNVNIHRRNVPAFSAGYKLQMTTASALPTAINLSSFAWTLMCMPWMPCVKASLALLGL